MCLGIAEIDEKPIPQQLGDMPSKALDDLGTDPLVCTDHVTPVFGVELRGQFGGVRQVAEHNCELPSFRVRRRCSRAKCDLRGELFLHSRL
jgi:hypothetical protein